MSHGTHIQLHRSAVEGATPDVATMLEGEPAVNLADKKLWVKGATGELITLIGGVSAETVAGSSGQIQFNADSGFSANPNFVINSSQDPPRIGIGTSSPREVLEVQGTVLAAGISADGATFGGDIQIGGNIIISEDGFIGTASDDERIVFDGTGNDITMNTENVFIQRKLLHYGDGNTFLEFNADTISMTAGGTEFLEANANGVLHIPTGVSGGGATFGGTVIANQVTAAVNATALNINSNYALPASAGVTGDILMIAADGDLEFESLKTTATFIVDSDVPLTTGIRYKGLFAVPLSKMDVTNIDLRSHDVSPAGSGDSLSVALKFIQKSTALEAASPAIQGTVETVVIPLGGEYHVAVTEANVDTPGVGLGNNGGYLVVDVISNAGNHTNFTMLVTMEARP